MGDMMPKDKKNRIKTANLIIEEIANRGHGFFKNSKTGEIGRFEIDDRGRLWWVNELANFKRQRPRLCLSVPQYRLLDKGFPHGGTLRALLVALLGYIRTGTPINAGHFGPWPDWYSAGDPWGYGWYEMSMIRSRALVLGVAKYPPRPRTEAEKPVGE